MSESTAPVPGVELPSSLDEVDAGFMTRALRAAGVIDETNEVAAQDEQGVGMTAGYFSAIKKVTCHYRHPAEAPKAFVVKTWPPLEIAPKRDIQAMFLKDIKGYQLPAESFYPRPRMYLAGHDPSNDRWALIMQDAESFAEHKVHENELAMDDVLRMIPRLVDIAVAWEGCQVGEKARVLDDIGVEYWASDTNLARFKAAMPGGAKFLDKLTTMADSALVGMPTWDNYLGGPGICEMFTRRIDAFFNHARPENGATCTLAHGDIRGDNIFFCEPSPAYPDGWLCIDFQLMFRGPVPSDLADLLSTGSVLPEVYTGDNLRLLMHTFFDRFKERTRLYRNYTFEQFTAEYIMMTTIHFVYYLAYGAPIWQAGAYHNEHGMCVELGGKGTTEADLPPEQLRQRMWWRKSLANYRENFKTFDQYAYLSGLPENLDGLGPWAELPDHLR